MMIRALIAAVMILATIGCSPPRVRVTAHSDWDPFRVADLPATAGPSGVRPDAPAQFGQIEYSDGGDLDDLALLAVNDLSEYWAHHYTPVLPGVFTPVAQLYSYDASDPDSPLICGNRTYQWVNAFYCTSQQIMAWDRGTLLPAARKFFGAASVAALIAHEYGHAIQRMAYLVDDETPTLVAEQQADCFAGAYVHWVAQGNSVRFELNTSDGLDHLLAGLIVLRDPIPGIDDESATTKEHGTALDRISAFQLGFTQGPSACASINSTEVDNRRVKLTATPQSERADEATGDVAITEAVLSTLAAQLRQIIPTSNPPTLEFGEANCLPSTNVVLVSYCPTDNTLRVDLPGLQTLGTPASEANSVLVQGDNTAISLVISRYVLAQQKQMGRRLDTPATALRSACLTGVAESALTTVGESPGAGLHLTHGDVDEAVSGLLTNGLVASNIAGATVPAGFTRIAAFRLGFASAQESCYSTFQD